MERLRSDEGCPWDRKQKISAFKTFMLEEVYEIIEAIEKDDTKELKEEPSSISSSSPRLPGNATPSTSTTSSRTSTKRCTIATPMSSGKRSSTFPSR